MKNSPKRAKKCGAISAGIAHKLPDPDDQLDFMLDENTYNYFMILKEELNKRSLIPLVKKIFTLKITNQKSRFHHKPNYQKVFVTKIETRIPFPRKKKAKYRPKTVILAGKIHEDSFVQEVYFTDKKTAKLLKGHESKIGEMSLPNNTLIMKETNTLTDVPFYDQVRASMSDPYMIAPHEIDGDYYVTGAINAEALDVAEKVADNIYYTVRTSWLPLFEMIMEESFHYDPQLIKDKTMEYAKNNPRFKAIDFTEMNNPKILPPIGPIPHHLKIEYKSLENIEVYRENVNTRFNFGYNAKFL